MKNQSAPSSGSDGGNGSCGGPILKPSTTEPSEPVLPNVPPVSGTPENPGAPNTPKPGTPENPFVYPPNTPVEGKVDAPQGGSITVTSPPRHGVITMEADGSWRYTPDQNFVGIDEFTLTTIDENGIPLSNTINMVIGKPIPSTGSATSLAMAYGAIVVSMIMAAASVAVRFLVLIKRSLLKIECTLCTRQKVSTSRKPYVMLFN